MPPHIYGHICTKSSLALRGIIVLGGVIDPDFRGNLVVILQNSTSHLFRVNPHDVVAQIIFTYFTAAKFQQVQDIKVMLFITYFNNNNNNFLFLGIISH